MAESAAAAGLSDADFEALLESVSADPDRAFEDLRELLFDATTALITCASVDDCEFPDVGEALPTCLAVGSEAACALDCDDGRECPSGMRCEQVDAGGERWICF